MLKKGQIFQGTVERIDFPNRGIVRTEQGTVVVKNMVPGRVIEGIVNKKHGDRLEGRILQVLKHAPEEITENICRHFEICGGCQYQCLPYEKQLQIKEDQIRKLLDSAAREPYTFDGIFETPGHEGYRNKMEYTFGDSEKDGPLEVGMHRRGSFYDIETVEDCRIADSDYAVILSGVRDFFRNEGTPYFHRRTHIGVLRHLVVRKSHTTKEILVNLVTSRQNQKETEEFLPRFCDCLLSLKTSGTICGILHTWNDSLADAVIDEGTDLLYGKAKVEEKLFDLHFEITPYSFFQTNTPGAEVLYGKVREYAGSGHCENAFDLYSGTGTITQIMAAACTKITGIEIVEEAVDAARRNAESNGLDNCCFIAGDVLQQIDLLKEQHPDLIILDPPRDGIHPKAIGKILSFGAKRMIYISCKPSSLARDLIPIQAAGYRMTRACAVDMFPGTAGTEAIALLERADD